MQLNDFGFSLFCFFNFVVRIFCGRYGSQVGIELKRIKERNVFIGFNVRCEAGDNSCVGFYGDELALIALLDDVIVNDVFG